MLLMRWYTHTHTRCHCGHLKTAIDETGMVGARRRQRAREWEWDRENRCEKIVISRFPCDLVGRQSERRSRVLFAVRHDGLDWINTSIHFCTETEIFASTAAACCRWLCAVFSFQRSPYAELLSSISFVVLFYYMLQSARVCVCMCRVAVPSMHICTQLQAPHTWNLAKFNGG